MWSSLKHNLTYYLCIAAAGIIGIGLLLISGRLHASDLLPLAMLLSNTYGDLSLAHNTSSNAAEWLCSLCSLTIYDSDRHLLMNLQKLLKAVCMIEAVSSSKDVHGQND